MPTVNNIAELANYVNQMTKQAMNNGSVVKKTVIDTGKKHVQEDVYDVYTPKVYQRSGELKENWKTEPTADGMSVYNDRRDDGRYVAEIVETGKGYQFDFEYNGVARPFTKNTADELRDSSELTEALKKDLKSVGIDSV